MKIQFDDSFNWGAVLKDLAAGARIDLQDYYALSDMAILWPTCACGQLCDALPRKVTGAPVDDLTRDLGIDFLYCIREQDWGQALACFHKIEDRTRKLLEAQEQKG